MVCDYDFAEKELGLEGADTLHFVRQFIESATCFSDILLFKPFHCIRINKDEKILYKISLDTKNKMFLLLLLIDKDENEVVSDDMKFVSNSTKCVFLWEVKKEYE